MDVGQERALLVSLLVETVESAHALRRLARQQDGHRIARGDHAAGGVVEVREILERRQRRRILGKHLVHDGGVQGVKHEHHHVVLGGQIEKPFLGQVDLGLGCGDRLRVGDQAEHAHALHDGQRTGDHHAADAPQAGTQLACRHDGNQNDQPHQRGSQRNGGIVLPRHRASVSGRQAAVHEQRLQVAAHARRQGQHEPHGERPAAQSRQD